MTRRIGWARVPFLSEGGLGARQRGPTQLPVGMQPVGVAGENDDPVFLTCMIQGMGYGQGGASSGG